MRAIYAIYFKTFFRRFVPICYGLLCIVALIIAFGVVLAVYDSSFGTFIRMVLFAPLVYGICCVTILVATFLPTLPGHIRFYKMVRYQEDYRGELASKWKHAVPCVVSGVNTSVFTADDWLIAVGEVAVKRKNYRKQRVMETRVNSKRLKGTIHHIEIYLDNMPWKKVSIKSPLSSHAPNAEIMKSIGKWQRNQNTAAEKSV